MVNTSKFTALQAPNFEMDLSKAIKRKNPEDASVSVKGKGVVIGDSLQGGKKRRGHRVQNQQQRSDAAVALAAKSSVDVSEPSKIADKVQKETPKDIPEQTIQQSPSNPSSLMILDKDDPPLIQSPIVQDPLEVHIQDFQKMDSKLQARFQKLIIDSQLDKIQNLEQEKFSNESEKQAAQKDLRKAILEISKLKNDKAKLKSENTALETAKSELETQKNSLLVAKKDLEAEKNSLQEELTSLETKHTILFDEHEDLKGTHGNNCVEFDKMVKQLTKAYPYYLKFGHVQLIPEASVAEGSQFEEISQDGDEEAVDSINKDQVTEIPDIASENPILQQKNPEENLPTDATLQGNIKAVFQSLPTAIETHDFQQKDLTSPANLHDNAGVSTIGTNVAPASIASASTSTPTVNLGLIKPIEENKIKTLEENNLKLGKMIRREQERHLRSTLKFEKTISEKERELLVKEEEILRLKASEWSALESAKLHNAARIHAQTKFAITSLRNDVYAAQSALTKRFEAHINALWDQIYRAEEIISSEHQYAVALENLIKYCNNCSPRRPERSWSFYAKIQRELLVF